MKKEVEFQIQDMLGIGMTLIVVTLGIAYGLQVTGDVKEDMGNDACAGYWNTSSQACEVSATNNTLLSGNPEQYNASEDGILAIAKIPSKLGTIVTIIVAAIIIGILTRYLWVRFN